jgi:hypothetical protein
LQQFGFLIGKSFSSVSLGIQRGFTMAAIHGRLAFAIAGCLALAAWGCSSHSPDRVPAPDIDPSGAAAQAISMYDTNHDGAISGDELNKCPALKTSIKLFSAGDGKATAETITAELEKVKASKVGIISLLAKVNMDGAKLDGATVLLEPEPFMGSSIAPATGKTNADGVANLAIGDPQERVKRGVNPGLYKVRINKQVGGKEMIPARYNKDTELGIFVSQDNNDISKQLEFNLTSQ